MEVDLWRIELDLPASATRSLCASLSSLEVAHMKRFATDVLRHRYGVAHGALRHVLGGYVGVDPGALVIGARRCRRCNGPHGKPTITPSNGTSVQFNLSHSGGTAVVAVGQSDVGVDVEEVRVETDLGSFAGMWLTGSERDVLGCSSTPTRDPSIIRWWVRKEACLKASGVGLNRSPRSLEIRPTDDPTRWIGQDQVDGSTWHVCDVAVGEGLVAGVASEHPVTALRVHDWSPMAAGATGGRA